ncbi:MAG: transketolase C-terminal domain-containing protein [Polyangiaceae bacterium]
MGDLIGNAVEGTLTYAPQRAFDVVRTAKIAAHERAALFADLARLNALYMIARAGSGHVGSSFSSLDVVTWLHLEELREDPSRHLEDLYFSSKGHDAPGLYAVLTALGKLPFESIHKLRQLGGLPGHPDVGTPHIVTNTGSLGMGISKAKGMVLANRRLGRDGRVFVLTGDGELQEGQIWESLISGANKHFHEITVIVDHNKVQSDARVDATSSLGDLEAKFAAFGWHVARVDGHDLARLGAVLTELHADVNKPKVVIADTVKGKGVSFMEHTAMESDVALYRFHSGAPDAGSYSRAVDELVAAVRRRWEAHGLPTLALETTERPAVKPPAKPPQRLIGAYSDALLATVKANPKVMVLDADLMVDTGQKPSRDACPDQFLECGIAEMDMVSQAGGMALRGLIPICHSFACFMPTRANEHIYNNATEHTKVVYVASLAGCLPGGPGHSHQSVRDISAVAAVPGLVMIEPSSEAEVPLALDYCVNKTKGSGYLRLVSVPYDIPFALPAGYSLVEGQGVALTQGTDVVVFGYGPILLSEAYRAAESLRGEVSVKVVNLPWLNRIDPAWLVATVGGSRHVVTLDNHYRLGGQGDLVASALAVAGSSARVHKVALDEIPACGTNAEVLRHHGLDAESLAARFRAVVKG